MTYNEFLEKLRGLKFPAKWFFHGREDRLINGEFQDWERKEIRCQATVEKDGSVVHFCPITIVHSELTSDFFLPTSWILAANALGLPIEIAQAIVDAADNTARKDPKIREELLAAIGLKE